MMSPMNLLSLLVISTLVSAEPAGEPAAQATLDAWMAAQNQGQFAAYSELYATKFNGVKRSGPRVRRMNREVWLKDRQGMFKKKMTVGVSQVVFALGSGTANVSFVQRWSSGKYQDEGPKRMLLVLEAGRYRIAQEEMLGSKVEGEYMATEKGMLMVDDVLVLASRVDKGWGTGPATADDSYIGHRAVDEARLPDSLRALAGKPVELFDAKAKRCTATIAGFELQARAEWHFGTLETWKTTSKASIAAGVWAQGKSHLIANLKGRVGTCGALVFGRVVGSSSAPVVPFQEVKGPLLAEARENALAALSTKIKGEDWSQMIGFTLAKHPTDASRSILFISIDPEQCTPEETLSAELIWQVDPTRKAGSFSLLSNRDSENRKALLGVDLDGDGFLEVIYEAWPEEKAGILIFGKAGKERRVFVEIPFLDCPC